MIREKTLLHFLFSHVLPNIGDVNNVSGVGESRLMTRVWKLLGNNLVS
jgi:hypothetical protein